MNRTILLVLMLVLTFLGLADAWYLTQSAISGTELSCSIAHLDGCNIVAQSKYSHLLGIPLALYGVVFYAVLFILAASLPLWPSRLGYRLLHIASSIGVIASVCFLFIQFVLIRALCIYCVASAVISVFVWLVARKLWRKYAPRHLVTVAPLTL